MAAYPICLLSNYVIASSAPFNVFSHHLSVHALITKLDIKN